MADNTAQEPVRKGVGSRALAPFQKVVEKACPL